MSETTFGEIALNLIKWMNSLSKNVRKINFKEIIEKIYNYVETVDSFSEKLQLLLIQMGWPPLNDVYLKDMIKYVTKFIEQDLDIERVRGEFTEYLLHFYNETLLNNMLNQWKNNPCLVKRMPIIDMSMEAHFQGKYYLSIPALLAQIEGIIASGFNHEGYMGERTLKNYIEQLSRSNNEIIGEIFKSFYLNYILAGFAHGSEANSSLSRHAILHGGDISYGTKENSLKTIILLDYLQDALKQIKDQKNVHPLTVSLH